LPSGGDFEKRQPGGNADLKCDDKITEKILRKSHAKTKADIEL